MGKSKSGFESWKDGVLARRQLRELCKSRILTGPPTLKAKQCGESAIDLTVDGRVFRLSHGSVKPFGPEYFSQLQSKHLLEPVSPQPDGSTVLHTSSTYLLPIQERLDRRAILWDLQCHGQATAKSSIGRLDVLARLIVDGATVYEGFTPECLRGSTGQLFVEVTPITFNIRITKGVSLTQLRLFKGRLKSAEQSDEATSRKVLASHDRSLRVDLTPTLISKRRMAVAFRARSEEERLRVPIDLRKKGKNGTNPRPFWEPCELGTQGRFQIDPDAFYILRSKELITVPRNVAVYCRASDEAVGEMRIHYAGFVHPRFGLDRKDGACGTPLIFEVRGHNVPVLLADGERMATLVLYKMSEPYDGNETSAYGSQTLKLSNHFRGWTQDE